MNQSAAGVLGRPMSRTNRDATGQWCLGPAGDGDQVTTGIETSLPVMSEHTKARCGVHLRDGPVSASSPSHQEAQLFGLLKFDAIQNSRLTMSGVHLPLYECRILTWNRASATSGKKVVAMPAADVLGKGKGNASAPAKSSGAHPVALDAQFPLTGI